MLLSPDGCRLAVYFKSEKPSVDLIRVWNLSDETHIDLPTNIYRDWNFAADSKLLVVTAVQNKGKVDEHSAAQVWDVSNGKNTKNGKLLQTITVPEKWRSAFVVGLSPDGALVAIGGNKRFGFFDVKTGALLAEKRHSRKRFFADLFADNELPDQLSDIEFSPDGKMLMTGGEDGRVKLWRIE